MDGIIEVTIPEIEGLENVFADNTIQCSEGGINHSLYRSYK